MSTKEVSSVFLSVIVGTLLSGAALRAENRLHFGDLTAPAGATGAEVLLKCNADQPILGFSFAMDYDETVLTVTSVTAEGTLSEPALTPGSGFFAGHINLTDGRAAYGCVLDYFDLSSVVAIPAGDDSEIARIVLDIDAGAGDTTTEIQLGTFQVQPPPSPVAECVLTTAKVLDTDGVTVLIPGGSPIKVASAPDGVALLTLSAGTITVEDRTPRIISLSQNQGVAGDVLELVGEFLGEPGLVVTVCGAAADAALEPDGQTLLVTAPVCGANGWSPVEVCTTWGCDSEANGFLYEDRTPVIESITDNTGLPGDVFTIVGDFFGEAGLTVTVCSATADVTLQPDGRTLLVTAPGCGAVGWAAAEVCTEWGCASEANGFEYEILEDEFVRGNVNNDSSVDISDGVGVLVYLFLSEGGEDPCLDALDANDTGDIDLSDAIYIFNFLFLGGPVIPEPYPLPGVDETLDSLPLCDWPD